MTKTTKSDREARPLTPEMFDALNRGEMEIRRWDLLAHFCLAKGAKQWFSARAASHGMVAERRWTGEPFRVAYRLRAAVGTEKPGAIIDVAQERIRHRHPAMVRASSSRANPIPAKR